MQRLFDLVISGLSILILSPLLLPIILLLRITGEGEVFFSQERMGKGGSLFSNVKCRLATIGHGPSLNYGNVNHIVTLMTTHFKANQCS